MPEAAMDEKREPAPRHDDVGIPWQIAAVEAEPQAGGVESASDQKLGLGVAFSD